ncbi:hypothetical protein BWGOE3_24960 [Bacillus mycoides]|uniref:hypothetical protein n=1 Tax=Bacillus mycoides TaxID=1405 RepID=UPI000872CFE7|nr:hypothetical protein [Bacillus mycoides]OFD48144.1 hypothetical protein BWGOE3_24960 [Bacillus mycoides]
MKKNDKSHYIHEYTLRDKTTRSIKIEPWRSLKDEMLVPGIKDSGIFQIQMKEIHPNKKECRDFLHSRKML